MWWLFQACKYQLVENRQLDINVVPDDKTSTDVLQKWDALGEGQNQDPINWFSKLQFYKADVRKDDKGWRKRPVVSGSRDYFSQYLFCFRLHVVSTDSNPIGISWLVR